MRLLQYDTHGRLTFRPPSNKPLPPYAILSHTWLEGQEVLYQDVLDNANKQKQGWLKLEFCGQQAKHHRLNFFWIDTCCIDKTDPAELAEAITSMYRWYSNAEHCFVFLADVHRNGNAAPVSTADIGHSRWFTRGWTLQELLAPAKLSFFSQDAQLLGTKLELASIIHEITGIDEEALRCMDPTQFLPQKILSWADKRNTNKEEDKAYSLVGILGLSLLPQYGEGEDCAMDRLHRAIGKATAARLSRARWATSTATPTPESAVEADTASSSSDLEAIKKTLRGYLSFDGMNARRFAIDDAAPRTCTWLVEHPLYHKWCTASSDPGRGQFLWITGNAGTGKSTLIKFADDSIRKHAPPNSIQISFYFNARAGIELLRSTRGMYRALILQLFEAVPELIAEWPAISESFDMQLEPKIFEVWELERLLHLLIERLNGRTIHCVIDALDECDEREIEHMIGILDDAAYKAGESGGQLHVILASRHYPTIVIPEGGSELILEHEDGHTADLEVFIERRLRIGADVRATAIKKNLLKKANQSFIWLVLVIPMLNDTYKRAKTAAVESQLDCLPPELSKIFRDILQRDETNKDEFLLALQWILFAQRPLSPFEFYIALEYCDEAAATTTIRWNPSHDLSHDDMVRRVRDSSKGLAEVTKSDRAPQVQFIHESVRDYLLKENGLVELWPSLGDAFVQRSHDRLKTYCLRCVSGDLADMFNTPVWLEMPSSHGRLLDWKYTAPSFGMYSTAWVLEHAELAVSPEALQDDFLHSFPLKSYITNAIIHGTAFYHLSTPLMYVLAARGLARLISSARRLHFPAWQQSEIPHYLPLLAALDRGHESAARALLKPHNITNLDAVIKEMLSKGKVDSLPNILHWACQLGCRAFVHDILKNPTMYSDGVSVDLHTAYSDGEASALGIAARKGYLELVQLLLQNGADTSHTDCKSYTPLLLAAAGTKIDVVELLLKHGASASAQDRSGLTAMHLLMESWSRWPDCVDEMRFVQMKDLLIGQGLSLDAQDHEGNTPLMHAATRSDADVSRLLALGANHHHRNKQGQTLFLYACGVRSRMTLEAIQRLAYEGAVTEADDQGNTALMLAICRGRPDLISWLIESGADINAVTNTGQSVVAVALAQGSMQTVDMLLAKGADEAWLMAYNPYLTRRVFEWYLKREKQKYDARSERE